MKLSRQRPSLRYASASGAGRRAARAPSATLIPVVYVFPPLFILGGWAWGCRESYRPVVGWIAFVCAAAFAPALALALETPSEIASGAAYALSVMATTSCAMLLHERSDPGDGGEETADGGSGQPSGNDPSPLPVDWEAFERRYWKEVRRRERQPVPGGR